MNWYEHELLASSYENEMFASFNLQFTTPESLVETGIADRDCSGPILTPETTRRREKCEYPCLMSKKATLVKKKRSGYRHDVITCNRYLTDMLPLNLPPLCHFNLLIKSTVCMITQGFILKHSVQVTNVFS